MNTEEEILEKLRRENPFVSSSVGDPSKERFPDVPGLGDDVFRQIKTLIRQSAGRANMPCAAAVLGEPGSGKTHLIGRLMDESRNADNPFYFAYIIPFLDHHQGFRYLLRETFVNLIFMEHGSTGCSRLDMLASMAIEAVLVELSREEQRHLVEGIVKKNRKDLTSFLNENYPTAIDKMFKTGVGLFRDEFPGISKSFLKVFFQYCFYQDRKSAARDWLKGEVVDAESLKLLDVRDRSRAESVTLEQEALDILKSLDKLLNRFGVPLVFFFDQLENFGEAPAIRVFEKMLYFLCDQSQAMVPIVFFRGADWARRFNEALNEHIKERISSNLFILKGCSREQAVQLIRSRLNTVLDGVERPWDLYPFKRDETSELNLYLGEATEFHPRKIIIRAQSILSRILYDKPLPGKTATEILEQAFDQKIQEIRKEFNRYPPDRGRLLLALELYLSCRNPDCPYTLSSMEKPSQSRKYISLVAGIKTPHQENELSVALVIDVEQHHRAVGASLKRGADHMKNRENGRTLYLRDNRCRLPKSWIRTHAILDELKNRGGEALFLEADDAAWLYALSLLKFDVEAGDISREDGRPVRTGQLKDFISLKLDGNSHTAFRALDRLILSGKEVVTLPQADQPVSGSEDLVKTVMDLLRKSSAQMMVVDKLVEKLPENTHQKMEPDILISRVESRDDLFSIISAKDGKIIRLKGGGHD